MNRIAAEWTMALAPDGRGLPDDASWATNESQMTLTVHVPTFAGNQIVGDVGGVGEQFRNAVPAAFDNANVWNIHLFVAQCLGYTKHVSPQTLNRWPPARHPWVPHLRATRISRMHGIGERKRILSPLSRAIPLGRAIEVQVPALWELTILFQSLPYEVKADSEVTSEAQRYVTPFVQPTAEILNKPGGTYTFIEGTPAAGIDFPQPIGLIYGTYDIVQTWHQVPKSAVLDAEDIPSKLAQFLGKVNDAPITGRFRAATESAIGAFFRNASSLTTSTYAVGQLLLTGVVLSPEQAPIPPQVMGLGILETPRTYSVELRYKFDPKGHNKKPYDQDPTAASGTQWYACTHNGQATGRPIYETTDYSEIFKPLII